ncbi:hypothetical protein ABPG72_018008 [Tetrahymena utriculariae]
MLNNHIIKRGYVLKEKLGQGNYVEVFRAIKTDQNKILAIKKLINPQNKLHLDAFNKQKDILNKIKNKKYALQILDDLQFLDQHLFAIVLEFYECNFNEIFEVNQFSFEQIVTFSYQILQGLLVLQQIAIIIKLFNADIILYCKDKGQFVIADFGYSQIISQQQEFEYKGNQIIEKDNGSHYEVDVYHVGLLILELFISRNLTLDEKQKIKSKSLFE